MEYIAVVLVRTKLLLAVAALESVFLELQLAGLAFDLDGAEHSLAAVGAKVTLLEWNIEQIVILVGRQADVYHPPKKGPHEPAKEIPGGNSDDRQDDDGFEATRVKTLMGAHGTPPQNEHGIVLPEV